MSALITMDPGNKDMKSIVGQVLLWGLVIALGYGLYTIMPQLIEFAENIYYLAGMVLAGVAIVWWLMSGGWRAIKYAVYGLGQLTLGKVIEMNPFNILEYRLEKTEDSISDLLMYREKLEGKGAELFDKIDSADKALKEADSQKLILTNKLSKGHGTDDDNDTLELVCQEIVSNTEYINGIKPVYNDLLRLLDYTKRAHRSAELELKKAKKDLSMKRDLFETVTTSAAMVKKAWSALLGDENLNKDAEKAIEVLKKDIGAKIGKIKTGIKVTSQFMNGKDLENAAKLKTTLKELENVDLQAVNYSSTIDSSETKAELGNLKGSNKYAQYLDLGNNENTSDKK